MKLFEWLLGKSDMNKENKVWTLIFSAWFVAGISTLGSLFFSEIMKLPPCTLCWYQRIFMFPLSLILPLGLFPLDKNVVRYALILSAAGLLIAFFHLLLAAGVIPESIQPCRQGIPCSKTVISWFGFVTIPFLSMLSFLVIVVLLVLTYFQRLK
ncbi:MAG: disulfide oxidoreductase [Spirochaetia bacterium]|nr:disulfide oxidoreductase [Spirochaetia bacterium]